MTLSRAASQGLPARASAAASASGDAAGTSSVAWTEFRRTALQGKPAGLQGPGEPILCVAPPPPSIPQGDELNEGLATLLQRYTLTPEQIGAFRRDKYIRLKNVVPAAVLAVARAELVSIVAPAMGGRNVSEPDPSDMQTARLLQRGASDTAETAEVRGQVATKLWEAVSGDAVKAWHVQMGWTQRPCVNRLVLAPRIGAIVAELLGVDGVRLYHDNTLSRSPGSLRTKWHCDDGPGKLMATASPNQVTVWIPFQRTPPEMGSLTFARAPPNGHDAWSIAALPGCPDEKSSEYDAFVSAALEAKLAHSRGDAADGVVGGEGPDSATYEIGDLSIHMTSVYHCASANLTTATRMILASTYFEDGATLRDDYGEFVGGQSHAFERFCPGVGPGEVIASRFNPLLAKPLGLHNKFYV